MQDGNHGPAKPTSMPSSACRTKRCGSSRANMSILTVLRAEADIPSYSSHSDQLIAKPRKKAMQSAPDHPRCMALEGPTTRRLIRPAHSWRSKSALLCSKLPATSNNRKPTNYYHSPSWTRDDSVTVFADVPSITGISDRDHSIIT